MIYVHVAENHRREVPEPILEAANSETDPDRRILAMLGARGAVAPRGEVVAIEKVAGARKMKGVRGANVAQNGTGEDQSSKVFAG